MNVDLRDIPVSHHAGYVIEQYADIGFAEIQRWFAVYTFDTPFFYQTSNVPATIHPLTHYPTEECLCYDEQYFLPQRLTKAWFAIGSLNSAGCASECRKSGRSPNPKK